MWGGGAPLPTAEGSGEGAVPLPHKIFVPFYAKMTYFAAS